MGTMRHKKIYSKNIIRQKEMQYFHFAAQLLLVKP